MPPERIIGVETGACPHSAVRDDISINLNAVEGLERRFPRLELLLIESGGDNLAATFSPELVDYTKIDLAEHVGASVEVMHEEAQQLCGDKPVVLTDLRHEVGLEAVLDSDLLLINIYVVDVAGE